MRTGVVLLTLVGFTLALASGIGFAQEEDEAPPDEDDAIPEMAQIDGVGIGRGGPLADRVTLELAELNDALTEAGYEPLSATLWLRGGGGSGGLLEGLRFGGFGAGGETSSVASDGQRAQLSLGYGGLWLGYGLVATQRVDAVAGLLLGRGSARLKLIDREPTGFRDAIDAPTSTVLERGFFALRPGLSVGVQVLPWASLSISGGYLAALGGEWALEETSLEGPPDRLNGWSLQVRLQFGGRG